MVHFEIIRPDLRANNATESSVYAIGRYSYLFIVLMPQQYIFNDTFLPPTNEVCKGYVFTPVCQSFCSWGGGCLPQCMLGYTPSGPEADTLPPRPEEDSFTPEATPTRSRPDTPQTRGRPDTPYPLEHGSRPPCAVHAGRYRQQAGGTHPAGMHYCYLFFGIFEAGHNYNVMTSY